MELSGFSVDAAAAETRTPEAITTSAIALMGRKKRVVLQYFLFMTVPFVQLKMKGDLAPLFTGGVF